MNQSIEESIHPITIKNGFYDVFQSTASSKSAVFKTLTRYCLLFLLVRFDSLGRDRIEKGFD
jgi:hypothetical protein